MTFESTRLGESPVVPSTDYASKILVADPISALKLAQELHLALETAFPPRTDVVTTRCDVLVRRNDEELWLRIVDDVDADVVLRTDVRRLTKQSACGQKLLGAQVGDIFEYNSKLGLFEVEILEIHIPLGY